MVEGETRDERIARFYEERRGDVSGWRPAGRRLGSRGRSTSAFSVRFTDEELDAVEAAADRKEMPMSTFIRQAALEAAKPPILD